MLRAAPRRLARQPARARRPQDDLHILARPTWNRCASPCANPTRICRGSGPAPCTPGRAAPRRTSSSSARSRRPFAYEDIKALGDAKAWCLEPHSVTYSRMFFSHDRKAHDLPLSAPDTEAVRSVQREAGSPVNAIWAGSTVVPAGAALAASRRLVHAEAPAQIPRALQRSFPRPRPIVSLDPAAGRTHYPRRGASQ